MNEKTLPKMDSKDLAERYREVITQVEKHGEEIAASETAIAVFSIAVLDDEIQGGIGMAGKENLIIEAIKNAMIKSDDVAHVIRSATQQYLNHQRSVGEPCKCPICKARRALESKNNLNT